MDSLLSNYASSDEEEKDHRPAKPPSSSSSRVVPRSTSSLFSSLPPPDSSSTFSSLPPNPQDTNPKPKRVVQLKLPILTSRISDDDDDNDDEDEPREGLKPVNSSTQPFSSSSFLSNLPAPKYATTLGALPSGSGRGGGGGRRSIIEADVRSSNSNDNTQIHPEAGQALGQFEGQTVEGSSSAAASFDNTPSLVPYGGNYDDPNYENYTNSSGYDTYGDQVHMGNNSIDYLAVNMGKVTGKRGRRSDVPMDIVEVKQDDLMKNRPRVDQSKSTGIAFGPSYQAVSTKGKPSKLHKRKHQISSLYFDMKQNETELSERRSRGFLTKAQTQGKYGW
ncbi:uncharacterized protein LOC124911878 [Impatiens glandulifera]|uniref:uncharacterized protein LOC124911878 n=1 Tax=Impatiens glandulifera TaxID=253017 RepID=UPI001FB09C9A|nr:uncharacterized protein LOC124911878 [Impatiens glandulifera]